MTDAQIVQFFIDNPDNENPVYTLMKRQFPNYGSRLTAVEFQVEERIEFLHKGYKLWNNHGPERLLAIAALKKLREYGTLNFGCGCCGGGFTLHNDNIEFTDSDFDCIDAVRKILK